MVLYVEIRRMNCFSKLFFGVRKPFLVFLDKVTRSVSKEACWDETDSGELVSTEEQNQFCCQSEALHPSSGNF